MSDKIIKVNFTDKTKPILETKVEGKKDFKQARCKHHSLVINEQYRTVECDDCKCIVDAFDVLLARADYGESVIREIGKLLEQRDDLRKSVDGLLKEEKNTKARLRSARTDLAFIENKKFQDEGKVG